MKQRQAGNAIRGAIPLGLAIAAAIVLAGCTSTPEPPAREPYDIAWDACIDTYDENPVVNQNGDAITVLSPEESCTHYVETVGRDDFIETWTDEAWVTKHRATLRELAELREQL